MGWRLGGGKWFGFPKPEILDVMNGHGCHMPG